MTCNTRLVAIVALASVMASTGVTRAAGIYQCTQADGSITLSDAACPPDTLTREYRGEATGSRQAPSPSKDPWSVMNQVHGIDQRHAADRQAATAAARQEHETGRTQPAVRARKPSYQEAHRKALEAAGYREDSQLSKAQREQVAEELAKSGYDLREPKKKATNRKGTAKTKGTGDAEAARPAPASAVDPRNASLLHHSEDGHQSTKRANQHE